MARIRSSWSVIAVWAVCLGTVAGAQVGVRSPVPRDGPRSQPNERQIPVGTSAISGTVTTTDTEWPVPGARVTVSGQARCIGVSPEVQSDTMWLNRTVITDALGQFSFPRLPPGAFRISVSASQNQFLDTNYGQRRPGGAGQFIQLAEGQTVTLKVPVLRGAAIAGIVRGPDGEPLRDVQVRAMRADTSSGGRRWQATHHAQTDDRGAYRVFGLEPGDYIVSATPNPKDPHQLHTGSEADLVERAILSAPAIPPRRPGLPATIAVPTTKLFHEDMTAYYLPTYAPGSTTPSDSTIVTVAGSEERTGVDVRVQLIAAGTIKGVVSTHLDAGVTVQLWLQSDEPPVDRWHGSMFARMNTDGTFAFRAVAPGTYTVFAQTLAVPPSMTYVNGQPVPQTPPVLTESQKMWGKTLVTVPAETTVSAAVQLQASRSISGIVVFDTRQPPDLTRTPVTVSDRRSVFPRHALFAQTNAGGRRT